MSEGKLSSLRLARVFARFVHAAHELTKAALKEKGRVRPILSNQMNAPEWQQLIIMIRFQKVSFGFTQKMKLLSGK